MLKKKFFAIVAYCVIFLSSCTDNNPTNFFEANSSSETPLSSSATVESSSSLDILSSSFEIESSSSELSSSSTPISYGTLTDERDGQVYKTVKIGNQTWMAENLNYASPSQIDGLDSASWCNNNEPDSCVKYGRLYRWDVAIDSIKLVNDDEDSREIGLCVEKNLSPAFYVRGICPENWHIPSFDEWTYFMHIADELKKDDWGYYEKSICFWSFMQTTYKLDDFEPITDCERAYAFCYLGYGYISLKNVEKRYTYFVRCIKDKESE